MTKYLETVLTTYELNLSVHHWFKNYFIHLEGLANFSGPELQGLDYSPVLWIIVQACHIKGKSFVSISVAKYNNCFLYWSSKYHHFLGPIKQLVSTLKGIQIIPPTMNTCFADISICFPVTLFWYISTYIITFHSENLEDILKLWLSSTLIVPTVHIMNELKWRQHIQLLPSYTCAGNVLWLSLYWKRW